jgi:hypothetical protein
MDGQFVVNLGFNLCLAKNFEVSARSLLRSAQMEIEGDSESYQQALSNILSVVEE